MKDIICSIITIWSLSSFAQDTTANVRKGVMLYGYDPVSYFTNATPQKGQAQFAVKDQGVVYHFANPTNKNLFIKSPEKYRPAYEGWCATAVASGYKYDIDPLNYKITDGRLFLFYKGFLGDAKKDWIKNEPKQITTADKEWPRVRTTKE